MHILKPLAIASLSATMASAYLYDYDEHYARDLYTGDSDIYARDPCYEEDLGLYGRDDLSDLYARHTHPNAHAYAAAAEEDDDFSSLLAYARDIVSRSPGIPGKPAAKPAIKPAAKPTKAAKAPAGGAKKGAAAKGGKKGGRLGSSSSDGSSSSSGGSSSGGGSSDGSRSPSPMQHVITCSTNLCSGLCECNASGQVECRGDGTVSDAVMTGTCRTACHC